MSHYHTEEHPNYPTVPAVKSCKEENENSIHGTELKQNNILGAELKTVQYMWHRAGMNLQEDKMAKDEFCGFYLTRKTWIIKMNRRKTNVNDCPSVH